MVEFQSQLTNVLGKEGSIYHHASFSIGEAMLVSKNREVHDSFGDLQFSLGTGIDYHAAMVSIS